MPIGEGPDEIAHLDYVFYRFTRPDSSIRVSQGLTEPGLAPQGQGHQAPLYYSLSAALLRFVESPSTIGPFWDYQAGLWYSSFGEYMGGDQACNVRVREDLPTGSELRVRHSILLLRGFNALLFSLSALMTFMAARLAFGARRLLCLSALAIFAGAPTAIWRSTFVTNDNLVALAGSTSFLIAVIHLNRNRRSTLVAGALVSGGAFLIKYTGIATLGNVFGSILLNRYASWQRRLAELTAAALLFVLIVAAELTQNYRVEGEVLLGSVVAHAFPWLYKPNSISHLLFESDFTRELLSRFWLEFHNLGILDTSFPLWKAQAWWILSAVAAIGLCSYALKPHVVPECGRRIAALAMMSFASAIILVFYLALSFPLAGGRYLHTALTPIALLCALGLSAFGDLLFRKAAAAGAVTIALSLGFMCFGMGTTYSYQVAKYADCRQVTSADVPAGAAFGAADIDGDGVDEIYSYHRHPGRLFFLRYIDQAYRVDPSWTRAFALQGDVFAFGDLTADGRDDVIIYRPGKYGLFFVKSEDILTHNTSYSYYADRAIKIHGVWLPRPSLHHSAKMLVGDIDGSEGDEIVLYNPRNVLWMFLEPMEVPEGLTVVNRDNAVFGGAHRKPFLVPTANAAYLGTYDSRRGVTYIGSATDKQVRLRYQLPAGVSIVVTDVNGDSIGDIVYWKPGDHCVEALVSTGMLEPLHDSTPVTACFVANDGIFALSEHYEVFAVNNAHTETPWLAAADRRSGEVWLFPLLLGTGEQLVGTRHDFGYMRPTERYPSMFCPEGDACD